MTLLGLILGLTCCLTWVACTDDVGNDTMANITQPDKDMYVIHATVYQVGIITNRTDNMTDNFNTTGNQESVTLFKTNGTNVDLSGIPEPFQTNVTAQSLVGVAPVSNIGPIWGSLSQLTQPENLPLENVKIPGEDKHSETKNKRSLDKYYLKLFKRDTKDSIPVKVENGAAVIPPEIGLQSIGLPSLLSFNHSNISEIPVPIPNTSVIHYAKINTLVQKTE